MFDKSSPLALAAHALALSYVDAAFIPPVAAALGADIDSPVQFPDLVHIRRPFQAAELFEGCLIEGTIGLALDASPRYQWVGKTRVAVTDSDRALVERNIHGDLGPINPPAAGESIGQVEIDGVAVDLADTALVLLDIKRAPCPGDQNASRFAQACLAARRSALREGLRFADARALRIRWFASSRRPPRDVITRESIDEALSISVREVVDHAIATYRQAFAPRIRGLLEQESAKAGPLVGAGAEMATAAAITACFDDGALRRAFARPSRLGRVA